MEIFLSPDRRMQFLDIALTTLIVLLWTEVGLSGILDKDQLEAFYNNMWRLLLLQLEKGPLTSPLSLKGLVH